jgi:hypothetical protein
MRPAVRLLQVLWVVLLFPLVVGLAETEASIDPQLADFGEVQEGETKTIPIHITNYDSATTLNVALLLQDGSSGFILKTHMLVLGPGETQVVYVAFVSSGEGEVSDTLVITYLGGRMPEEVLLTAVGVREQAPIDIHAVAAFFDQAVEQGSLAGFGAGRSGDHRLKALHNMILEAEALIGMGDFTAGCEQLQDAVNRLPSEGETPAKNAVFAAGESAQELAAMMEAVMGNLCGNGGTEVASFENGG